MQRDFQRSKVYAWENSEFEKAQEKLTLTQCRDLASQLYGARVKVKDGRGRRKACAFHRRYPTIALPRWSRIEWVVAHEVAHLLHRTDDVPGHGAIWMRSYILLLEQLGHDAERVTRSAIDYGLKVAK